PWADDADVGGGVWAAGRGLDGHLPPTLADPEDPALRRRGQHRPDPHGAAADVRGREGERAAGRGVDAARRTGRAAGAGPAVVRDGPAGGGRVYGGGALPPRLAVPATPGWSGARDRPADRGAAVAGRSGGGDALDAVVHAPAPSGG